MHLNKGESKILAQDYFNVSLDRLCNRSNNGEVFLITMVFNQGIENHLNSLPA
jgi:hypothetical protein